MAEIQSAEAIFERQFLTMRCGLLDLAADFDRLGRAGELTSDADRARLSQLQQAIEIVASSGNDRAERLQLLFSDEYVSGWNQS